MPFILLIVGAMLLVSGVKGTDDKLIELVKSDFAGGPKNNGFLSWMLAIGAVTAVGYYKPIKPISNALLLLIFMMLFLSNRGIASQFDSQTSNLSTNTPAPTNSALSDMMDSLKTMAGKLR